MDDAMTATLLENLDRRLARLEQILPTLATKDDLRTLATKEEIRTLATKEEVREEGASLDNVLQPEVERGERRAVERWAVRVRRVAKILQPYKSQFGLVVG